MKHNLSQAVAFGGVTAALALVIMGFGGLIPIATYVCAMLCGILLHIVFQKYGDRIAWAWYVAVSILSLIIGPDKEAALMFLFLGYYPIIKPKLSRFRFRFLLKLTFFNISALIAYALLIFVIGLQESGFQDFTILLGIVLLIMGNISFFLLDHFLDIISLKMNLKQK